MHATCQFDHHEQFDASFRGRLWDLPPHSTNPTSLRLCETRASVEAVCSLKKFRFVESLPQSVALQLKMGSFESVDGYERDNTKTAFVRKLRILSRFLLS